MRRIYITLVLLILAMVGMAYLYFSNLKTERTANDLPLNTVSKAAALIFSFENDKRFYDILSGQELLQKFIGTSYNKAFHNLQQYINNNQQISELINSQKIYIGFSPGQKNGLNYLISTQVKAQNEQIDLSKLLNKGLHRLEKLGTNYQLTFADSTSCFLTINDKLILISNDLYTLKQALNSNSSDLKFAEFIKTNSRFSKNTLADLYIDYQKLPLLLKHILNSNLNGELQVFNQQQAFAALSYNFSKERILFSGLTTIEKDNSYLKLFENTIAQKISINNIIPENTANYTIYTFSNYPNWKKELQHWFEIKKETKLITQTQKLINDKYRLDLPIIFEENFNKELVTFQLQTGEKLGAIALKDGAKVSQLFLDLSDEYAIDVRKFKEDNLLYLNFGEPLKKFKRPFYTIINNYLIVTNNASTIQSFIKSYQNNSLLINDTNYQNFSNQLSSSATISYYINLKNSTLIFGKNLKNPYYKAVISKNEVGKFDAFAYQLSGDKNKFQSSVLLHYNKPKVSDTIDVN